MKTWLVVQEFAGKFLPHTNSGGKPIYGGFDYRISRMDSEGVEVVAGCDEAARWLPSIKAGIVQYCHESRDRGERFHGVKIEITKIYSHELATNDDVMKRRGRQFLWAATNLGSQFQSIEE